MADKITQKKKADIAVLKAAGYSNTEIGNELGVSESTVRYHLKKIKEEAEEVGPHQAVVRVIIEAGPDYGLFRITPFKISPQEILKKFEGGEK